jgi:hypothetical protein
MGPRRHKVIRNLTARSTSEKRRSKNRLSRRSSISSTTRLASEYDAGRVRMPDNCCHDPGPAGNVVPSLLPPETRFICTAFTPALSVAASRSWSPVQWQ